MMERILKNSTTKYTNLIENSIIWNRDDEFIPTKIPMLNVALSGKLDGGLSSGITQLAGPSKHFKTLYALHMVEAFQQKYPDGIVIFYDSEFGTPKKYFNRFEFDLSKWIHSPMGKVEDLRHDISKQLDDFKQNGMSERVMVLIDSVGNLASKKEVNDAIEGKDKADMTRAKAIKSLTRIICVDLKLLNIPCVIVNHSYKSQDFIPKEVPSGGTGIEYNSDSILLIGRKQEKDKTDLIGYQFTIKEQKSRFVKEGKKIPITVTWDEGIHKYSGLSEIAEKLGIIERIKLPGKGGPKGFRFKDMEIDARMEDTDDEFWAYVIENSDLKEKIAKEYCVE